MMRVGTTFNEFDSDGSAMVLLEGDKPLGPEAHRYYDEIVKRLEQTQSMFSTSRIFGATR